jgi:hypothetical protein
LFDIVCAHDSGHTPKKPNEDVKAINIPLQITSKNMELSDVLEAHFREATQRLDVFYDHIIGCQVLVETPHRCHRKCASI